MKNVEDGIQIQVYKISKERVTDLFPFIPVKVKKNLRKSQALYREQLRKLRPKQNDGFFIKKERVSSY